MFEHVVRKGGLKESEARWFFQQLLVGVDYVHRMVSLWSTSKQWLQTYGESQRQRQQLILPGLMLTPQSHKLLLEVVSVELAAIMVSASGSCYDISEVLGSYPCKANNLPYAFAGCCKQRYQAGEHAFRWQPQAIVEDM